MSRHSIQRNWKAEAQRVRGWKALKRLETIEIPIDKQFWRIWKDDKAAMREAGYRVTKVDGKWRAFLVR